LKSSDLAIVLVKKIPYFTAQEIKSKSKYHISMGHQTGIGQITFFSCAKVDETAGLFSKSDLIGKSTKIDFDHTQVFMAEETLPK